MLSKCDSEYELSTFQRAIISDDNTDVDSDNDCEPEGIFAYGKIVHHNDIEEVRVRIALILQRLKVYSQTYI
jgi:hypothetical protein